MAHENSFNPNPRQSAKLVRREREAIEAGHRIKTFALTLYAGRSFRFVGGPAALGKKNFFFCIRYSLSLPLLSLPFNKFFFPLLTGNIIFFFYAYVCEQACRANVVTFFFVGWPSFL